MIAQLPAAPSSSPVVFSTDQVRVAVASALDRIAERGWDIARDTPMAPSFQRSDVTEVCVLTCPDHDPDGAPTGDTFTLYWFRTADGTWWDETFARTQLHPLADPRNADASLCIHPVDTEPSAWLDVETYAAICAMGQPPRDPEAGPPPGPTSVINDRCHYLIDLHDDLIDAIAERGHHPTEDINAILRREFKLDHYC